MIFFSNVLFFFFPWPIHFDLTCKRSDSPPPLQKNALEKGEKEGGEQEGRGVLPSITYKQKKRGALKNFREGVDLDFLYVYLRVSVLCRLSSSTLTSAHYLSHHFGFFIHIFLSHIFPERKTKKKLTRLNSCFVNLSQVERDTPVVQKEKNGWQFLVSLLLILWLRQDRNDLPVLLQHSPVISFRFCLFSGIAPANRLMGLFNNYWLRKERKEIRDSNRETVTSYHRSANFSVLPLREFACFVCLIRVLCAVRVFAPCCLEYSHNSKVFFFFPFEEIPSYLQEIAKK